ncbi:MFS transporter [Streptomyces gougerotii]|uniref:MFS transporter n=3 Tax=Streptomyces diastaticus group TaxID=2849069 RepID=A0A8H9LS19_9ACTN|nr:MFS transporter [Streptomyces gougerotii]GGU49845.1 MFS transporter [Streptomyces diastaticus subsp. diastaticus]GGU84526.1 MFS transporter [Streptomyces gougerotii]
MLRSMSQHSSRVPLQSDSAAPSTSTAPATYRTVLAVREFRMIFLAQVIATLGNVVAQITLSIMVYQRTQSPLLSSLTFALGFVPYVFGATLLSAVADRHPARDVMVACQALSCVVVGAMAIPGMPIPVLLVLLLVLGTVAPVFQGARAASLPDLLSGSGYVLGRSLLRLVSQSTQIIGFAVGGLLLLVMTSSQALLAAAAGFGLAVLLLRFGTRRRAAREPEGGTQGSVARASLSGVRQVLAVPGLRPLLLLTWLPPAFAVAPEALASPYADELGGGPAAVGLLLCAAPAGSVVGELLAGTLLTARTRVRMVLPTAVLMFLPLLGFAFRPGLWTSVALLTVCGLGFTYAMGLDQRVLDATPEELRGRALTITLAGLMITQGLGFAAAGAVAEFLPPHIVIVIVGSLGLLTLAWCGASMRPRKDRQATRLPVADQAA